MKPHLWNLSWAGLLLAWWLTGCAGYQLGPTQGRLSGAQSVQVNTFANKTIEPRLSEAVTLSLRRQLQQDGTYRLDTKNEGDIVVVGTITEFRRLGLSYLPGDTRTARDYRILITAQITATERVSGRVIVKRQINGQSTIRVGSDLVSAERQAVPLVAEDLARNITGALVDGTW